MNNRVFIQILLVIIGALATGYAGYWFGENPDQIIEIEYRKDVDENFENVIGSDKNLEIYYDEKIVKKMSNVSYNIINNTNKNLGETKLYFETKNKDTPPIFYNIRPPENYPAKAITPTFSNEGQYIFELEYLNRANSILDGIVFTFYFLGDSQPEMLVKTGNKGVSIKERQYRELGALERVNKIIKNLWYVFVAYLIVIYVLLLVDRQGRTLKNKYFRSVAEDELEVHKFTEREEIINRLTQASNKSYSLLFILKHILKRFFLLSE